MTHIDYDGLLHSFYSSLQPIIDHWLVVVDADKERRKLKFDDNKFFLYYLIPIFIIKWAMRLEMGVIVSEKDLRNLDTRILKSINN